MGELLTGDSAGRQELAPPGAANGSTMPYFEVRMPQKSWEVVVARALLTIGRSPASDIFLDDPAVSRRHAYVERRGDDFFVVDLRSTNGTWIGHERVTEHALWPGDVIRIGKAHLAFRHAPVSQDLTIVGTSIGPAQPSPLEIKIDKSKRDTQVEEIAESAPFKELQARARQLRRSRH